MKLSWWREPKVQWLTLCFVIAFLLRLMVVQQQAIVFWYDQARDFTVSRQIIEQRDLKIQGPSASGTKDTVYHGVLYYYLIAPIVSLSHGSPLWTTAWLALLGSSAVLPTYWLTKEMTQSEKTARWAALLLSFSFYHVQASTWISNPQIMSFITPWIFLFSWKSIVQKNDRFYPWLALVLAIGIQSAIVNVFYVIGVGLLQLFFIFQRKDWKFISLKSLGLSLLVFGVGVSSMIFTEFLMIHRGILSLEVMKEFDRESLPFLTQVETFFRFNWRQLLWMTSGGWLIGLAALVIAGSGWKNLSTTSRRFILFWWLSPWLVLGWHYRDSPQTYIGLDVLIIALISVTLAGWQKNHWVFGFLGGLIFMGFNLWSLNNYFQVKNNVFSVQKDAFLRDQLDLVDQTYQLSFGQPFSISTSTNPFGINVTWGYLYSWRGQQHDSLPIFVGSNQAGLVGETWLKEGSSLPNHFLILEPDTGLDAVLEKVFLDNQDQISPVVGEYSFGSLKLQDRSQND